MENQYEEESYTGGNKKSKLPPLEMKSGYNGNPVAGRRSNPAMSAEYDQGLRRTQNQMNIEDNNMNQDSGAEDENNNMNNMPMYNQNPY